MITPSAPHVALCYTLLVSMTLQIIFFFPYSSYTSINIALYKRKVEIACNGKSPGQQETLHNLTVLIFHFRSSKIITFAEITIELGARKKTVLSKAS